MCVYERKRERETVFIAEETNAVHAYLCEKQEENTTDTSLHHTSYENLDILNQILKNSTQKLKHR